jgi:hypothetical protein
MNTIDNSSLRIIRQPRVLSLAPVAAAHASSYRPESRTPNQALPTVQREPHPNLQEIRADLVQRGLMRPAASGLRNQQALASYRSLDDLDERDRISRLLGVDEYA